MGHKYETSTIRSKFFYSYWTMDWKNLCIQFYCHMFPIHSRNIGLIWLSPKTLVDNSVMRLHKRIVPKMKWNFIKKLIPKTVGLYRIPPKMAIERRFQDIHSNFLEIVVNKKGIKFGSDFFSWNYTFETPIKAVRSKYKVQWVEFISEEAFPIELYLV